MVAIPEIVSQSSVLKPLITSGLGISAGTLGGQLGNRFPPHAPQGRAIGTEKRVYERRLDETFTANARLTVQANG